MFSLPHAHVPALPPDTPPSSVARSRPDLCRALVEAIVALNSEDELDERLTDRLLLIGWLERRGRRLRLTPAGNLVYAHEVRRMRQARAAGTGA